MNDVELKPCPFCGEEAEIVICDEEGNLQSNEYKKNPWSGLSFRVFHPSETCPVGHLEPDEPKWLYDTEAEAIKCWNTRYERTCNDVSDPPTNGGFWPTPHFKCSECGKEHVSTDYVWYCPNCGCKVKH